MPVCTSFTSLSPLRQAEPTNNNKHCVITITTYHVFSDGFDSFFSTRKEAEECYRGLAEKGFRNRRIYKDVSDIEGEEVEEIYIKGAGEFPY